MQIKTLIVDGPEKGGAYTTNSIGEITELEVHQNQLFGVANHNALYELVDTVWILVAMANERINIIKSTSKGLILGGNFTTINGQPFNRIAQLTGSGWVELHNDFTHTGIEAIGEYNGDVIAGGQFKDWQDISIVNLARWGLPLGISLSSTEDSFKVYPNPCNDQITISSPDYPVEITLYNSIGHCLLSETIISSTNSISLPESIADGTYFLHYINNNDRCRTTLVIDRN